ncbi:cytochrome P450 [Streptomyces javensis]|uniref:Cytochrome P450 n=1 Tax=Streptomyces javensis TaxID=114698 RepID=A0ABS0RD37_9ACTN|nr:cytochrome P450 [Streptomyces javensis]MBI0315225.1 cytochrome P450 [Streptomyces javensis]
MTDALPIPTGVPTTRRCPFELPTELLRLSEQGPLSRMRYSDGHLGWLVTGYSAARLVLGDGRFSNRADLARMPVAISSEAEQSRRAVPPGVFHRMDPPEHTRYRRLLTRHFTVRRMDRLVPRIEQLADGRLAAMERQGPPADLVADFAMPMSLDLLTELLGVPDEARERFRKESSALFELDSGAEEITRATQAIHERFRELIGQKKTGTAEDLLGHLAAEPDLPEDEAATIGMVILTAGFESTGNTLALGALALMRNPGQLEAVRADPAVMDSAVEELLRYVTVTHFGPIRTALEDVRVGDALIKAGDSVTLALPAVNRDPEHFAAPDTLDVTRPAAHHAAFGYGIHQCLGQQLARSLMRCSYARLFDRFPALRPAVPFDEIHVRTDKNTYGLRELPVTW